MIDRESVANFTFFMERVTREVRCTPIVEKAAAAARRQRTRTARSIFAICCVGEGGSRAVRERWRMGRSSALTLAKRWRWTYLRGRVFSILEAGRAHNFVEHDDFLPQGARQNDPESATQC